VTDKETRVDRLVKTGKNNPIIAFVIVIALVLIGLSTLTDSVDKLIVFASRYLFTKNEVSPTPGKGQTVASAPTAAVPFNDSVSLPKAKVIDTDVPDRKATRGRLRDAATAAVSGPPQAASAIQKRTSNALTSRGDGDNAADTAPKQLTDRVNDAAPPVETGKKPSQTASGCADEETLKHGLAAAGEIFSSTQRDEAYRKIVDRALCSSSYDIATAAAGKMFSSTNRDEAYMEIVKLAIKGRRYELANQISGGILSSTQRDTAKRLIVEAVTNQ